MLTEHSGSLAPVGATTAEPEGPDGLKTIEFTIGGMHCNACAIRVERVLARRPGVASAAVNLATARAFVTFDTAEVTSEDLSEAVSGIGYTALVVGDDERAETAEHSEHWAQRAAFSWVLGLAAFAVAMFGAESVTDGWVVLVLAVAVEAVGGWPFLRLTVKLLRHGATSMDTLIAVGTLAALAVSAVETIALHGLHVHLGGGGAFAARLHGVMAPVIIAILATGRAVEERARGRASRALHSLLGLRPPTARIVAGPDDDEGKLVAPESVPVGALVRVRAGETVPLDGLVVAGWSAVDESMLTGEPLPVDRGPGSNVTGGTRNGSSALVVRVTTIASESVLARLQRLVDEAQRDKPPLQRLADRVSSVFVPVILAGALVTFLLWWQVDGNFGIAVLSGIAVLLVACPCAMGLATPVAMMVGSGRASALGILIRSGDVLEQLARADIVAFDKTGTLTERTAQVAEVIPAPGVAPDDVLSVAAAVERESEHPIAVAIRAASSEIPTETASEVRELPGRGVAGTLAGEPVEVLRHSEVEMPAAMSDAVEAREARGETVVVVTSRGAVVGALAISTPVRPEAASAIAHLKEMGLRSAILSGDSAPAVGAVASELAVDDARASLSPADKLEALRSLQSESQRVVMVGDGTNDAPALAAADVGCAIGSGTEAALANSDVALLGADLEGVPAAIGIARSTLAVIHQNFGWAMGYNISALPLAAAGLLDPLIAAIAMGMSSLVVVLNSLRLTRLGRGGLESVRSPRVARGARSFALSVLVPVVLFGGATLIGEAISPARGQSLLPVLPGITTVSFPGGRDGEVYLAPNSPGVNSIHLLFEQDGAFAATSDVQVTAALNGGPAVATIEHQISVGHYVGYGLNLRAGRWTFVDTALVAGKMVRFSWVRQLG
jgi:Cu+-exporting ATPase